MKDLKGCREDSPIEWFWEEDFFMALFVIPVRHCWLWEDDGARG
jgi:hypothetical protein